MPGNSNAAERHIHPAKLSNQFRNTAQVLGIREHPLFLRHTQLWVNFTINLPIHKTSEGERAGLVNPLALVGKVLVHVDKPAVFQRHPVSIDQPYKNGVLPHRSDRTDKHRFTSLGVVGRNFLHHLSGQLIKDFARISQFYDGQFGSLSQFLRRELIIGHIH